jgi:NAD(P)-dependent dehydrogenase (short-subunit alcohol dehydrogenase family)
VNNAAIDDKFAASEAAEQSRFEHYAVERFRRSLDVNVTGTFLCCQSIGARMAERGKGSIVYFGAAAVLPGGMVAEKSAYAAAKAGVLALMQAVSQEERKNGVRANAVAPTMIRTAMNVNDMGADRNYVERESVADAVRWLCSDAARDVTGQTIRLGA